MSEAETPQPTRRHAATFVFVTVFVDAIGFGIIIPVMPALLQELRGSTISDAAVWGGYLAFVYAAMHFLVGPTLGNLSDRFGRRPVLLISLATLAVDYVIMALANSMTILFIGRLLAGISGATVPTANAYIADVTPPEKRAANFGLIGAGFGLGFIVGPVIGGLAGEFGTRVPFLAAAALAFLNVLYGYFVLPESLPEEKRRAFDWRRANPFGAAQHFAKLPAVAWFFVAMFVFNVAHYVYPTTWSYFTQEQFGWSSGQIGLSLAAVGVGFVIVQGWLIRKIIPAIGEVRTAMMGFVLSAVALVGIAFAAKGWVVYAMLPVTVLGAIVTPAMTGLMANRTADDAQGELQGALASVTGITTILSPLIMTQMFGFYTRATAPVYFPGAPYLFAGLLTVAAITPFVVGLRIGRSR